MDDESSGGNAGEDVENGLDGSDGEGSEGGNNFHPGSTNRFNPLLDNDSDSETESEISDYANSTEEEGSEDEDDDAAKCAVCFLGDDQNHKWRRLVILPCCGSGGKEGTSSTRFCAACILRMATTRPDFSTGNEYAPWDEERSEVPVKQFYLEDVQTETRRVIECPRCRDILVVEINRSHWEDEENGEDSCDCSEFRPGGGDWTNPKTARSISIRRPLFEERLKYAGKKVGVAHMLWQTAFLHHSFIPRMALGQDADKLLDWGIVHKKPGKWNDQVFRMDKDHHKKLIKIFDIRNIHATAEYGENNALIFEIAAGMGCAALTFLSKFRLDQALRTMNRSFLLAMFFKGYLPPFPLAAWQEWVVTALNIFSTAMIAQFAFITFIYVSLYFGVCLTVCSLLRRSSSGPKSILWQIALVSYFVSRAYAFVLNRPSAMWVSLVAPKATMTIKAFIWG